MKLNEINDPVKEFLERNKIDSYKINSDGTVDVDGGVRIITKQSKFPVKFGRIDGRFDCKRCELTSLEGSPTYTGYYFDCSNNRLTSLEGAPSHVNGDFYCDNNTLTSLHDIHKYIKEINGGFNYYDNPIKDSVLGLLLIKGIKKVYIDNTKVTKILNKYLGQGRSGVIGAQQELLDAGLDEYAKL